MKILMIMAISLMASTQAFSQEYSDDNSSDNSADTYLELSAAHPDIMTPNCQAHAYFPPNTSIAIIEIPTGKCDSFRGQGTDMYASESRISQDGKTLKTSMEIVPGRFAEVSVMNIDGYPFRIDKIRIYPR